MHEFQDFSLPTADRNDRRKTRNNKSYSLFLLILVCPDFLRENMVTNIYAGTQSDGFLKRINKFIKNSNEYNLINFNLTNSLKYSSRSKKA